jgi:AraC family transcriptional regulator
MMEFQEVIRDAFVMIGYSSVGKWDGELVYPIPSLWKRAASFIGEEGVEKIVGICLSPRSNQYFYTCGIEIDSVNFHNVKEDMNLHTFPQNKYLVFTHRGQAKNISST